MLDTERPLTSFPPGIESKIEPDSGASYGRNIMTLSSRMQMNNVIAQTTHDAAHDFLTLLSLDRCALKPMWE